MNGFRRRLAGLGAVAAMVITLAACAVLRADVRLDIPVFAGGFGTAFYAQAARQFEALHPGVRVDVYGDPRIQDQVRVRVIDGDYPDAACIGYLLWPSLVRAGKVMDLTPALAGPNWEGDARWGATFQPGALETWRIGGRVYGLPVSYSCWTIFYNRALFRAHGWTVPRTWKDFFTLCGRIRAAGLAPVSLPGLSWLYANAFFRAAYFNLAGPKGWDALNALVPGTRTDSRFVRAAAVEQRVTTRCAQRGWEGEDHTGAELAFLQGRAAMTVSGSWFVNEMAGKLPADFELGAMNFPVFPDGVADPGAIQVSTDSFFVFRTGHPGRERLTLEFLRFLTSRKEAARFVRVFDSPPAVRGIPSSAYSARMRDTAEMILRAREAYPMRQLMLEPPALRQALVDESYRLDTGRISPEQYGQSLEAAAARDRVQAAHPDQVDMRHPALGCLLLAVVGLTLLWPACSAIRRRHMAALREPPTPVRRACDHRSPGPPANKPRGRAVLPRESGEAYFGRLRTMPGLAFVGPAFLIYAAFVIAPALTAFGWAFTRWDGIGPRSWAGLFNFKSLLFGDDIFWNALGHNVFLMVVPAAFVIPVALASAALIHRGVWGGRVFRVVFLFPNMLGGIAATLIWLAAYQPHGGLVNAGLAAAGRLLHWPQLAAFDGYPWLSPDHLYGSLIPIYLWMACGFNLILYLAAMEGIDPQLYEAAAIDGASTLRQFFTITLPMIRDILAISAVFLVIAGLNAFEMIWLLTQQMPSADEHTLATLLVTTMFQDFDIGRATALAVILFALVFAASAAVLRTLRREAIES
ncbi:MAG: extracellular solute-binding protein [Opitutaceae bacterium]